jgi:hypothetical protein
MGILKKVIVGGLCFSGIAFAQTNSIGTSLYDWAMQWNVSAFSVSTLFEQDVLDRGGSRFSSDNQITFKRKIKDSDWKFGMGVPFIYSSTGYDRYNDERNNGAYQEDEFFLKDLFVEFSNGKLALLPGEIEVFGSAKVYLPTSEYSQNMGQIARLKTFFVLTKPLATWFEVKYFVEPSYYAQTKAVYRNTFTNASGFEVESASVTPAYDLEQWLEGWVKITNSEGVGFKLHSEDKYYNSSVIENRRNEKHTLSLGPMVRFEIGDAFRFQLAYENEVDVKRDSDSYGLFKPEHTQLTLLTWIDI